MATICYRLLEMLDGETTAGQFRILPYRIAERMKLLLYQFI